MFGNLSRSGDFPSHYTDEGLPIENRRVTIIAVIASFLTLAWFCVGLRVFVRVRIVRTPGWDDLVIVFALLAGSSSAIGLCLCELFLPKSLAWVVSASMMTDREPATNYGMGHTIREVPDKDREMFFMLFYISNASFAMSNALVKLSILLQYLRIFQDRMPGLRLLSLCMIAIVSIWGVAFSFMAWFPCFPVYQFYRLGTENNCYGYGSTNPLEVYNLVVASNATNLALNFLILILPIPLLYDSETFRRTRFGLVGLLFIGTIINIIAATRIVANKATADKHPDPMRVFPTIILLGESENRLSLVLASIPVFWPVVAKTWNNLIFVTREVKVESTQNLKMADNHSGRAPSTTEDEAIEAGLRHPGRLCEVDRYVRQLISPFAEGQEVESTVTEELHQSFTEYLEGCNVDFETVAAMVQSGPQSPDSCSHSMV